MKKITLIVACVFATAFVASAQTLKFGHINMQEVIMLMDEMDSARVELEKFNTDMQTTYNAMIEEYNMKVSTYEQMAASWTPAVLQNKQQEIRDLESRLQQYQQSAQVDMSNFQQQLMAPIQQKASEAVTKVGKANGLIYIFDVSMGTIPYFDTALSMDVTEQVKLELNIPLDKTLPQNMQR